jgi:hypothetical protein
VSPFGPVVPPEGPVAPVSPVDPVAPVAPVGPVGPVCPPGDGIGINGIGLEYNDLSYGFSYDDILFGKQHGSGLQHLLLI